MRYSVSDTAEYGDYTRGPRIVNQQTRDEMRKILSEIQSGQFARNGLREQDRPQEFPGDAGSGPESRSKRPERSSAR